MGFSINPQSFGLGFAAGLAAGYGIYRTRELLRRSRESSQRQMRRIRTSQTANRRYTRDLIQFCQRNHLAGEEIALSEIVVEPRFMRPPRLAELNVDEASRDIYEAIPFNPQYPHLMAPYNVRTMSIEDLGRGDNHIALLGQPGSGRTTALMSIALWSLSQLEFTPPRDRIQQRLDEEDQALSADERAERIKSRFSMEALALEQLAQEKGRDYQQPNEDRSVPLLRRLSPMYVHLGHLSLREGEYGRQTDPAEPLVRALQAQVESGVTAKVMPRDIYRKLNQGEALVLLDGYDDLSDERRIALHAWFQAFLDTYGRNFVIIAGPAAGYGPLMKLGLSPLFLRPWGPPQARQLVERWTAKWGSIVGRRRATPMGDQDELVHNSGGLRPLDVTLRVWAAHSEALTGDDHSDWVQIYLGRRLPEHEDAAMRQFLMRAAALQLDEGGFTPSRMVDVMLDGAALDVNAATAEDAPADPDFEAALGTGEGDADAFSDDDFSEFDLDEDVTPQRAASADATEGQAPKGRRAEARERRRVARSNARLFKKLTQAGLVLSYRDGLFQFRYRDLAAYLASFTLKDERRLRNKADQPEWTPAMAYASQHTGIDAAVQVRLTASMDVLANQVLDVLVWLSYAGPKVGWRRQILQYVGNLLLAENQYVLVRERLAAALVGSRDRGALVIFRQALDSDNAPLRKLACLGLGAMRDEEIATIERLSELLRDDPAEEVKLAAAFALGAIGTEDSLIAVVEMLTQSQSEPLRRAIAEALALDPDVGYETLYDAVNADDLVLRRAAVFGLSRINTDWALISIYDRYLNEDQWYVQSAAEQVFIDMQEGTYVGARAYPQVGATPWLRDWVTRQTEEGTLEAGLGGVQLLEAGLNDQNDAQVRSLAALTAGQLAQWQMIDKVYERLYDSDDSVRNQAFRALGYVQEQMGYPLPFPA